jgi:phenylacetate-coenzyme A ligase PaaK-like adenylate-forming protein
MATIIDTKSHEDAARSLSQINSLLAPYIPPQDSWNPVDKVIYPLIDPYRAPLKGSQEARFEALKWAFAHHYNSNYYYRKYCAFENVGPGDIKIVEDLEKIPLIPDLAFKQYPSGKDFARWLATIYTGHLPQIIIEGANPTFDEVINAFNAAGVVITYSSGTSGHCTIIPRDQKTFRAAQYIVARSTSSMTDLAANRANLLLADHVYVLSPNPKKTNLFIGKASSLAFDLLAGRDVQYAMDYELTIALLQTAMSPRRGLKGKLISSLENRTERKIVGRTIEWLERYEQTEDTVALSGPPFLLLHIMDTLQKANKCLDFGERGTIVTGGGWKIHEDVRVTHKDFRERAREVLGIPETHCLDIYGMCEGNAFMSQCPEGHYLHIPYTFFEPLILSEDLTPVGYGECGRFAFLDAAAQSYPGFVITGDQARMLEHCPVCDRPGPVLEPEVQRVKGEEVRGCSEELRKVLAGDLGGDTDDTAK